MQKFMLHKDLTTSPEGQDERLIAMQMVLAVRRLSAGGLIEKQPRIVKLQCHCQVVQAKSMHLPGAAAV